MCVAQAIKYEFFRNLAAQSEFYGMMAFEIRTVDDEEEREKMEMCAE